MGRPTLIANIIYFSSLEQLETCIEEISSTGTLSVGLTTNLTQVPDKFEVSVEGATERTELRAEAESFGGGVLVLAITDREAMIQSLKQTFEPEPQPEPDQTSSERTTDPTDAPPPREASSSIGPADPRSPSSSGTPKWEIQGHVRPINGIEDVLEITAAKEIQPGMDLTAIELVFRAVQMNKELTLVLGDYKLELSAQHQIFRLTTPDGDSILEQLVRTGDIKRHEASRINEASGANATKAIDVIMSEELVANKQLLKAMKELIIKHAEDFLATTGDFVMRGGLTHNPNIALSFDAVAKEFIVRAMRPLPAGMAQSHFSSLMEMAPTMVKGYERRLKRMKLPSRDVRFLEHVDGTRPLFDVSKQTPLPKEMLFQLLLALMAMGLCVLVDPLGGKRGPEARLEAWLKRIEEEGPFGVLGCHWTALPAELTKKFEKISIDLDPGGDIASASPEAGRLAATILARAEDAYQALQDPMRRAAERRALPSDMELKTAIDLFSNNVRFAEMRGDMTTTKKLRDILSELKRM